MIKNLFNQFLFIGSNFLGTTAMLNVAVRSIFGIESSQISFFYFLYYCALAGGFSLLLDTSPGTAQEYRAKVGVFFSRFVNTCCSGYLFIFAK